MDLNNLTKQIEDLRQQLDTLEADLSENQNAFFLCSMALIIFLMQCGFAFLEAGAVRSKNTTNILIKNLLDSCIAIVGYWSLGWAFAFGTSNNEVIGLFVGHTEFFLSGMTNYPKFFFQYVFAATSATIVSGAVAERCEFFNYVTYCTVISTFVYPILTHWGWNPEGWMFKGITSGSINTTYVDFAGAGVVHLCGGTISFAAAYIIGPRIGRFPKDGEEQSIEIKGHSVPFAALGGFILMFGFLAFNGGSMADIVKAGEGEIVALAMINTMLSGAFAALTYLLIHYIFNGKWTLLLTINACLAGMVSSCAGCNNMEPWASSFTGIGAGLIYLGLSKLMISWKVDDPLDAFAVHAGGGFWGLFSTCIISKNGIVYTVYDAAAGLPNKHLVGQAFAQLGWQMVCALAIMTWSLLWMVPIFLLLRKIGKLRVPEEVEINGLDIYKHGEAAYPLHAYGHGWDEFEAVRVAPTENNSIEHRRKSMMPNQEISLEQLAAAYDRRTSIAPVGFGSPVPGPRKKSLYINPKLYEHPEHHHKAKDRSQHMKNVIIEEDETSEEVQETLQLQKKTPESRSAGKSNPAFDMYDDKPSVQTWQKL
ncbi:unnamed protein product [Auanema sp. JU1783]|nr:unnamed protein product [Auanema sp. JU1783]